jgi:hypothetical protein
LIASVAEFRVAVEPGRFVPRSSGSLPLWGRGLCTDGGPAPETVAGAAEAEAACGTGLEAFIETATISGTAAAVASR